MERPLCLDCITLKASVGAATAEDSFARITNVLKGLRDECWTLPGVRSHRRRILDGPAVSDRFKVATVHARDWPDAD